MNLIFVCIAVLIAWAEGTENQPASANDSAPVLLRKIILLENRAIGMLEKHENEDPADVVYNFARQYGLDAAQRSNILDNICLSLICARKQALI